MKRFFRTLSVFVWMAIFTVPLAFAGLQEHVANDVLAPLSTPIAIGGKVRLERFPLDGRIETLELERFEVFADNVEIKVYGENNQVLQTLAKPDMKFFRGRLASDPDSLIFISVSKVRVDGLVYKGERRFGFVSRPRVHREAAIDHGGFDVFIEESSSLEDVPEDGQGFVCDLDKMPIAGRPRLKQEGSASDQLGAPQTDGAISGNGKWLLNVAIDTDFELYTNVGSSSGNVSTYIANLIGAASTIYSRDLSTDLQLTYTAIRTTASDPFTVVPGAAGTWNGVPTTFSTAHALAEFGDYWHNTPPSAAARSSAVLISGKSQFAGVAWISTICNSDFLCASGNCGSSLWDGHYGGKYAYCGGIFPPVGLAVGQNTSSPYTLPASNYWPLLEFTHEFGHNVQSGHTHCIAMSASDQTAYGRTYVDNCYAGGGGGCFSGSTSVPVEKGTIMSYCHLISSSSSRFTFGQPGEASHIVPENMRNAISVKTPTQPTITAPASMTAGSSSNATIPPVGGLSYFWQVTNGTINAGQGTATLNFTATTNPTTVKLTATNAGGCSITNFVNVTVNGAVATDPGDTNSDGTADIFWHRDSGENYLWLMAPSTGDVLNALGMPSVTPTTWNIVANGDFNGDGKGDLIWRRSTDGLNYLWTLNGGTLLNAVLLPSATTNWSVVGAGDFNNDGKDDLFWRDSTGLNYVWLMNGATVLNAIGLPSVPNPWIVVGVGDANGDGTDDVFWREPAAGSTYLWTMGAGALSMATGLPAVDTTWSPVAVADFSGDGKADVFWRRNDGSNYIWLMNGAAVTLAAGMPPADLSWSVVAAGDFNADGRADLFWRNTSGLNYEWLLNGATLLNARGLPSVPDTTWRVKAPK